MFYMLSIIMVARVFVSDYLMKFNFHSHDRNLLFVLFEIDLYSISVRTSYDISYDRILYDVV